MRLDPGTRFDRYQIHSLIGRGGMGEVYLATDTRLGRKVALKLLPAQYTQDAERLRRFEQEAQAASALNHPNIVTIYEVSEAEGRPYIVTEYIEGVTLRGRLSGARMPVAEALEIAAQVVNALAAAHSAGIVHRDIKPENIMIRPDGYVKVLDFGLAKLTERTGPDERATPAIETGAYRIASTGDESLNETSEHEAPPGTTAPEAVPGATPPNETAPGVVMGTAQYMSPEQARGLRVDARTDIFSLGIVLYEMLAGKPPFPGGLSREIIDSILRTDPAPLSAFNPEVPEVVEWIVAKALVKDREERYQSSKEMLNDLKRLSRRLNVESEMERTRNHPSATDSQSGSRRTPYGSDTKPEIAAQTGLATAAQAPAAASSGGFFKQTITDSRGGHASRPLVVALTLALLLVGGLSAYQFVRSRRQSPAPFQSMQVRRFTTTGKASRAAISPDGNYVVYAHGDIGKQSLYIRQVLQSNAIEIVPAANVIYRGLTFSPDAMQVYYVVQEGSNPIQTLYQVPALGGVPKKILTDIDSPVALSPDRKRFAFIRRYRGMNEDALILASFDGAPERTLATRRGNDFFGISGLEWSPDGSLLACPAGTNTGGRQMYVALFNLSTGAEVPFSSTRWANVGRLAWMRDGSGLVISAVEQGTTLSQLWQLSYPKGGARRITNDLNDYRDLSLTRDSRALVTVQTEAQVNVWLLASTDPAHPRQITEGSGQYNGVRGLTWLPDGRLVYVSRVAGSQDLWLMNQDGKQAKQLTTAETRADIYPAVSPDGKHIVFVSTRTGNSNLYRYDLETGEQHQLTSGASEEFPVVAPDGRSVIYTETGALKFTLWKVDIGGGTPVQLTDQLSSWPVVSPDGTHIACWYRETPATAWRVAILPIAGGPPERTYEMPAFAETSIPLRWAPDGQGLCFVGTRDGVSNIWLRPLADSGEPRRLTSFDSAQIFWFDWSRDGRQLACSRGIVTNDVILISDFKP